MMNDLPLCRPEGLQTAVPTVHVTEGLSDKQNTQNDRLGIKKINITIREIQKR